MNLDFFLIFLVTSSPFIVFGIIFFPIGLVKRIKIKNWERTTGEIVKMEKNISINLGTILTKSVRESPDEYPSVRYIVDGKTYVYTSNITQSSRIPPGKIVDVLYDPHDPNKATIDTFVQKGTLFYVIGIILLSGSSLVVMVGFILSLYK